MTSGTQTRLLDFTQCTLFDLKTAGSGEATIADSYPMAQKVLERARAS